MKASDDGRLPTKARQLMYAARDYIQGRTGKEFNKDRQQYFTQTLLPDYINEHPDETADWDIIYDARGHLVEPHTNRSVPLGTLEVRDYLGDAEHQPPADIDLVRLSAVPNRRTAASLRRDFVHRKRRLRAAVRGSANRRPVRHRAHVDQGRADDRQPIPSRRTLPGP